MNKPSSSNSNPYNLSEADLALYPPFVSRLIAVIFCMMISQGVSLTLLALSYVDLRPEVILAVVLLPTLPLVSANFFVLHGRQTGIIWQRWILGIYAAISVFMVIEFVISGASFFVPFISLALSIIGLAITYTQSYQSMFAFLEKRWRIYRETGRTIIEEFNLSHKNK